MRKQLIGIVGVAAAVSAVGTDAGATSVVVPATSAYAPWSDAACYAKNEGRLELKSSCHGAWQYVYVPSQIPVGSTSFSASTCSYNDSYYRRYGICTVDKTCVRANSHYRQRRVRSLAWVGV